MTAESRLPMTGIDAALQQTKAPTCGPGKENYDEPRSARTEGARESITTGAPTGVPAPDFTLHRTPNQVVSLK